MGESGVSSSRPTILPEVKGNITEAVPCANRSGVTAHREVSQVVEGDSQMAILTTKGKRGI